MTSFDFSKLDFILCGDGGVFKFDVVGLVAHDATKRILCFVAHVKFEEVTNVMEAPRKLDAEAEPQILPL